MREVTLVIATQNRDKGREIMPHLSGVPVQLRGLWEWEDAPDVEETGDTLAANAILKAEAAMHHTGCWAFADDTGLEVDALEGAPGVYSARYAGPGATYASNRVHLLKEMEAVPPAQRTARFRTVIALARPGFPTETMEGAVDGTITETERGTEGFGYDAVFEYSPEGKTFAEMSLPEKNRISHRGRALVALRARLEALLAQARAQSGSV